MSQRIPALVCCIALFVACRHGDEAPAKSSTSVMRSSGDTAQRPIAAGDVRIVATGQGIDLALLGDTISSGLSQESLGKAREGTDTAKVKGSGFAASIEKMVKSSVQSAIGTRLGFPLSAVSGARYEGGTIVFEWIGGSRDVFEHTKVNNKPLLASFSPEDSKRFVDAVNARKRGSR